MRSQVEEPKDMDMSRIPYREAIGMLMYLTISTRPDIMYAVTYLARYVSDPGPVHWNAVKRVLRYLRGTRTHGIVYMHTASMDQVSHPQKLELCAHTDASWGDDLNRRRSTIGYVVFMGGVPVAWKSKLSSCVAGSTMEAEVIAANEGGRELVWLRNMTCEVMRCTLDASRLYMDNAAGMLTMSDRRITDRSKHIDIKYWWVMEQHELAPSA